MSPKAIVSPLLTLLGLMASYTASHAADAPRFADIFGDHAVLQRDRAVTIWGRAEPNAALTLTAGQQSKSVTADAQGYWRTILSPEKGGTAINMTITDATGASATLSDIVYGDVFLCSGQSNMEMSVRYTTNAYNAMQSSSNPNIRFVNIVRETALTEQSDLLTKVSWQQASPATTGDASATCYFTAEAYYKTTQIPVGMIHSSWGGSVIQAWMSEKSLAQLGGYEDTLAANAAFAKDPIKARADWNTKLAVWWSKNEPEAAQKQKWKETGFDDRDWTPINAHNFWEASGIDSLKTFDGVVWYRAHINLTKAEAAQGVRVELGPVDDMDTTYVNGVMVGSNEGWNTPRIYDIPAKLLKAGDNVVAVRAYDAGGGGGIWGAPEAQGVRLKDGSLLPFAKGWVMKISAKGTDMPRVPLAPGGATSSLSLIHNAMISPLLPYTVKAVLWYQGESNTSDAKEYGRLMPAWMADWRESFENPNLDFYIVGLAPYGAAHKAPEASGWGALRDQQRRVTDADAHAALVTILDIGDRFDIHPTQKTVIGRRMALAIAASDKGQNHTAGPRPQSAWREGSEIVVRFSDTDGGLVSYSGAPIGFELCAKGQCQFVTARIASDTIRLSADQNIAFDEVRYAYADSPVVNLFSLSDLPVPTFVLTIK